jgi:hypothetical protein
MTNHCLLIVMAVAAVLLTATPSASQPTTAYSMVEQYDFPPGIIPQGAQSYELRKDGSFELHFSGECGLQVGGFKLHYSSRLAGNIQKDKISCLEGVKVKIVLPWVRIREISRHGGEIRVHAGAISRSFPVSDFSVSPQC